MNITPGSQKTITSQEFVAWLRSKDDTISYAIVEGDVSIAEDKLDKKSINYCVFKGKVILSPLSVNYLTFENSIFESVLGLSIADIKSHVNITNCDAPIIRFECCEQGQIIMDDCRIHKLLEFRNIVNVEINLYDLKKVKDISFFGIEAENESVLLTNCNATGKLTFAACKKLTLVMLISGSYNSISVATSIEEFVLVGDKNRIVVGDLEFGWFGKKGSAIIEHADVTNLRMNKLDASDDVSFKFVDTVINTSWEMKSSIPKSLTAVDLNLSGCSVNLDQSLLTNCIFSNISWPKHNRLESSHKEPKQKNNALREAYRQLKQAMLKDGNNIDSLAFYRNELEEYRGFVKGNLDVKREDKFILFISWIFSDHGQSFARPIAWLLGMHLFFFLVAIGLNYSGFYFTTNHDWSAVWDFIGSYLFLLNPVHKLPDTNGAMLIVDFFMRLSSGFFIYHIIRASRKFAKV